MVSAAGKLEPDTKFPSLSTDCPTELTPLPVVGTYSPVRTLLAATKSTSPPYATVSVPDVGGMSPYDLTPAFGVSTRVTATVSRRIVAGKTTCETAVPAAATKIRLGFVS